jgi:hypothetical protein
MEPRRPANRRTLEQRRFHAWDDRKTDLEWIEELLHGSLTAGLRAIRRSKRIIRDRERELLRHARQERWSWDLISSMVGTSKQAVHRTWQRAQARDREP